MKFLLSYLSSNITAVRLIALTVHPRSVLFVFFVFVCLHIQAGVTQHQLLAQHKSTNRLSTKTVHLVAKS